MNYHLTILALISVFLTACVPPQVSLKKQASDELRSVDQVLVIPQSNLEVNVEATNPGNTGLIGALIVAAIDESRRSSAKEAASLVIEELQTYDFRNEMIVAMKTEITSSKTLKFAINSRLETIKSESTRRINFEKSTSRAVLFSTIDYQLVSGVLVVSMLAEIFPKEQSLHQYRNKPDAEKAFNAGNAMYYKKFIFRKQGISASNIATSLDEPKFLS